MSPKVKQANFRLPLSYMDLIDQVAESERITKAAVITRALDCLKASYDSGNKGLPVSGAPAGGASSEEIAELKSKLAKAESKVEDLQRQNASASQQGASSAELDSLRSKLDRAESRASDAERALDSAEDRVRAAERARDAAEARANDATAAKEAAEARARDAAADLATVRARAEASVPSAADIAAAAAAEQEVVRLRALVARHEATLDEKNSTLARREAEITSKSAAIEERDARIASLSEQLGAANAKIELAQTVNEVKAVMVGEQPEPVDDESSRALYMFNMLGGVMGAFQQQVADARVVGEQEGRTAVQRELQDSLERARNDGYRDAMTYLDNRVTTARETGAREERARIANMSYFERRRYLRMHIA